MFRSKKKKATSVTRKRKVIDTEKEENESVEKKMVDVENGGEKHNEVEDNRPNQLDDMEEDNDMLEKMRDRMKKQGKPNRSSMSFSSKRKTPGTRKVDEENGDGGVEPSTTARCGCLSFEEDTSSSSTGKKKKKLRIRPNLIHRVQPEDEDDQDTTGGRYSSANLAALKREQNVLRPANTRKEQETHAPEAMEVDANGQNEVEATIEEEEVKQGEEAPEEEGEEFISLHEDRMGAKKKKNRVTFGMDEPSFNLPKDTEVQEPNPEDEEDEDGGGERKWEEELMRRGGRHYVASAASSDANKRDPYPTHKVVPCASLSEIMIKLQRSMDHARMDNDRTQRDLARLEAETSLVEQKMQQQEAELLVSSEQFEYFQEMVDFVKGLAYCIRDKLPEIEAKQADVARVRTHQYETAREVETNDILDEIIRLLGLGSIQLTHLVACDEAALEARAIVAIQDEQTKARRRAKFLQGYQGFELMEEDATEDWDVFGDAIDELNALEHVYGRFQEWKSKFPDVYQSTYCDMAIGKLFVPYVQAEMVLWDPLGIDATWSLHEFRWFQTLKQHLSSEPIDLSTSDNAVLGHVVQEVVLGAIKRSIDIHFDPFSKRHVENLVHLYTVIDQCNASALYQKPLHAILEAVASKMTNCAQTLVLVVSDAQNDAAVVAKYQFDRLLALETNLTAILTKLSVHLQTTRDTLFTHLLPIVQKRLQFIRQCKRDQKDASWLSSHVEPMGVLTKAQQQQLEQLSRQSKR